MVCQGTPCGRSARRAAGQRCRARNAQPPNGPGPPSPGRRNTSISAGCRRGGRNQRQRCGRVSTHQQRAARMAESASGNSKRLMGRLGPTAENRCATKPVQRIKKDSYWRLLRKGLRPKNIDVDATPMDCTDIQKLGWLVGKANSVAVDTVHFSSRPRAYARSHF